MSRLIDADALSRIVKLAWETSDSEDFEKSVFIAIATAPTIEERKKGKWIKKEKCYPNIEKQMDYRYECSECGFSDIHNATLEVPFCWHCGADMRGDEHETD